MAALPDSIYIDAIKALIQERLLPAHPFETVDAPDRLSFKIANGESAPKLRSGELRWNVPNNRTMETLNAIQSTLFVMKLLILETLYSDEHREQQVVAFFKEHHQKLHLFSMLRKRAFVVHAITALQCATKKYPDVKWDQLRGTMDTYEPILFAGMGHRPFDALHIADDYTTSSCFEVFVRWNGTAVLSYQQMQFVCDETYLSASHAVHAFVRTMACLLETAQALSAASLDIWYDPYAFDIDAHPYVDTGDDVDTQQTHKQSAPYVRQLIRQIYVAWAVPCMLWMLDYFQVDPSHISWVLRPKQLRVPDHFNEHALDYLGKMPMLRACWMAAHKIICLVTGPVDDSTPAEWHRQQHMLRVQAPPIMEYMFAQVTRFLRWKIVHNYHAYFEWLVRGRHAGVAFPDLPDFGESYTRRLREFGPRPEMALTWEDPTDFWHTGPSESMLHMLYAWRIKVRLEDPCEARPTILSFNMMNEYAQWWAQVTDLRDRFLAWYDGLTEPVVHQVLASTPLLEFVILLGKLCECTAVTELDAFDDIVSTIEDYIGSVEFNESSQSD